MKLSDISKKIILVICVLAVIMIIACIVYYRALTFMPFAVGVALGSALNILKVILLEHSVDKATSMEQKSAGYYIQFQYLLRFLLTGAVLVAAVFIPFISLWGVAAGIFTLQVAAFSTKFLCDEKTN